MQQGSMLRFFAHELLAGRNPGKNEFPYVAEAMDAQTVCWLLHLDNKVGDISYVKRKAVA